jgi:hypothetical protein
MKGDLWTPLQIRIKTPWTTWPWLKGGRKTIFHCARGEWTNRTLGLPAVSPIHVRSACQAPRPAGRTDGIITVQQSEDWLAVHAIHVSFAFQSSTVQPDRKAKLYVYGALTEVSTRNLPGGKGLPGEWGWQPHRHLWADCLENVGSSMSHNPMGLHGLLQW